LRISKTSYLEHFVPIVIFFYSIEIELYDRKVYLCTYVRI
jgi:hypothetical protein